MIKGPYSRIESSEIISSERFEQPPVGLCLLGTLEVVVKDPIGHYLLILSPRYEPVRVSQAPGIVETGQWTPPYVQYDVPIGARRTVGSVYEAFTNAVAPEVMTADLNRYLDSWAAGLHGARLVDEFLEYKYSWSQPGAMKVYCIRRHRVVTDDCDLGALADPDMRQGFRFMPIDEQAYASNITRRECATHGRDHSLYLGRPLATDLAHITGSPASRAKLRSEAVEVPQAAFYREYEGILFCGDIANYGSACAYAAENMGTLAAEGASVAAWLRESAITSFTRIFLEAGASHVHTAGDGFLCALPTTGMTRAGITETLSRFLAAFSAFTEQVGDFQRRLEVHQHAKGDVSIPPLGTRLAIHYGEYRYGKMGLAASLTPAFDGASVIDVARLEQGLRALTKDPGSRDSLGLTSVQHAVAVSDSLQVRIGKKGLTGLRRLSKQSVRSKESVQEAYLYRF